MIVAVRLLSFFPHMSLPSLLFLMIWLDTQLLKHFAIRDLRISKTRPPKKSTFLHSRRCSSTLQSCYFAILPPNPSHSFLWRLGGWAPIPLAPAVFISLYSLFLFSFFFFFHCSKYLFQAISDIKIHFKKTYIIYSSAFVLYEKRKYYIVHNLAEHKKK